MKQIIIDDATGEVLEETEVTGNYHWKNRETIWFRGEVRELVVWIENVTDQILTLRLGPSGTPACKREEKRVAEWMKVLKNLR